MSRTVSFHAGGQLQQRQLPQHQELAAGHRGHGSRAQRIQRLRVQRSPLKTVPPDNGTLVSRRILLLIGIATGHRRTALLASSQFRTPGSRLLSVNGHLFGQWFPVSVRVVPVPETLVHLVLPLQRGHLVLLVPLLALARQLVPVPLRLLPKIQAPTAAIYRSFRRRIFGTLGMGGHVLQHLGVIAVRVPEIPVPPTGRLTLGVAQRPLILSATVQESSRPIHLGARRRRRRAATLRPVRAITRRIVAERAARRVGQRRGWKVIRRSWQRDRRSRHLQRRARQKIVERHRRGPRRRHVHAVQLLHLLLHRHHVENLGPADDDAVAVLVLSSPRLQRLDPPEESLGTVPQPLGAGPSKSRADLVGKRARWQAAVSQSVQHRVLSLFGFQPILQRVLLVRLHVLAGDRLQSLHVALRHVAHAGPPSRLLLERPILAEGALCVLVRIVAATLQRARTCVEQLSGNWAVLNQNKNYETQSTLIASLICTKRQCHALSRRVNFFDLLENRREKLQIYAYIDTIFNYYRGETRRRSQRANDSIRKRRDTREMMLESAERNVSCKINDSQRMFSGHRWHWLIINLRLM